VVLKTKDEYIERLKKMKKNVYIDGKKVGRLDERLMLGINVICTTFDLAQNPEFEDIFTATSHITGEKINRFCHIHQSKEDLLKKQEMVRQGVHYTYGCLGRCMGMDAMNALSVVTKLEDMKYGTGYYGRFIKYLKYWQENDIVGACAQTDAKGDRSKRPHDQADPDLYVHVVERKGDGIIVRGAKQSITIPPYSDEIVVLPTRAMREDDKDYAVAFAVPGDADGVKLVTRPAFLRKRQKLDAPIAHTGVSDSMIIFDNVFVPWERVFMCGEWELSRNLALLFALFHRHSYTGCKPAVSDILGGSSALVAECNGIERATHVREKLSKFIGLAELVYAAGVASAQFAKKSPSGTYVPDPVYANAGRRLAGENIYHEYDLLIDLAGGLAATLPPEGDFYSEETGNLVDKYMARNPKVSSEYVHRTFRLIENIACSGIAGWLQIAGMHGGGSPVMETIAIMTDYDIRGMKDVAKYLAGINKELPRIRHEDLVDYYIDID